MFQASVGVAFVVTGIPESLDLAFSALEKRQYATAVAYFQQVLEQQPEQSEALHYLAVAQHGLGAYAEARENFLRAIRLNPADPDYYHNFFTCGYELYGHQQYSQAIEYFRSLIALNMDYQEQAWIYLIRSLKFSDQMAACQTALNQALLRFPDNLSLRLENLFLFPQHYDSVADIMDWRQRFLCQLQILENYLGPERIAVVRQRGFDCDSPLFGIFAQGLNERETTQAISRFWEKILPVVQESPYPRRSLPGKIRVGMVSPSFWNHSTMHYFLGVIQILGQQPDLELQAFYLGEAVYDAVTEKVKAAVAHFEGLPLQLELSLEILNRHRPDILLYLDIGQDPFLYSLASNRIAPVQCALTGLPMTTGLRHMDYYLSGRVFEAEEAQTHYSEELVLLDGPIVTYLPPVTPAEFKTREQLGLDPECHLYLFPLTLFRVDPEFDQIIPAILRQDPAAEWLFVSYRGLEKRLLAHYQQVFPDLCERIRFLPWMDQQDFLALLHRVDVVVDALRLGAGNLAFLSLWVDTPLVTLPSQFLRCRIGMGLYRLMEIEDGIAADIPDYIDKALHIATDRSYQAELRARIRARKAILFENPLSTLQMADWFRQQVDKFG